MTLLYFLVTIGLIPSQFTYIYLLQVLQYLTATILFSLKLPKRNRFPLLLALVMVADFGWGFLLAFLREIYSDSVFYKILATLSLYSLMLGSLFILYKEKRITNILITWITGLCVREIVDVFYTLLTLICGANPRLTLLIVSENYYWNTVLYDFIYFILFASFYFLLRNNIKIFKDRFISIKIIIISLSMLVSLVVLKTFVVIYAEDSIPLYACCESLIGMVSAFLLILRTNLLKESSYLVNHRILKHVLASSQAQYQQLKTNIEVINMKAHDMKHQLEKYQDKLTQEEVESIRYSIEVYDKNINTGNSVLDTVLYTESLICQKNHIKFTYLCDGTKLDRIPSSQLYYLLSNILDNAIEASLEVEEEKNRIISFNIKEKNNQIVIQECNYFIGERKIANGLIKTNKTEEHHGYGLKSIRMIVEDNNGKMAIRTENNMFFLIVNLPLRDEIKE